MIDFFISFNKADREWAEWLAFALEENGFSVSFQNWDFRPGSNFVLEMQKAASGTRRTLVVLSPDYLSSRFAQSEWANAFADDPLGRSGKLLPVMVRHCEPEGLLRQIVHIDIVDLPEGAARIALIEGLEQRRAKPEKRPTFPGTLSPPAPFPKTRTTSTRSSPPYVPDVARKPTDADRRRFVKAAFATIVETFRSGLAALTDSQGDRVDTDIDFKNETDFVAEVFVDGRSRCTCHVWLGGMMSRDGISYFEGRSFSEGAVNEILSVEDDGKALALKASIGRSFVDGTEADLQRLSPERAADYLWRRFLRPLDQL